MKNDRRSEDYNVKKTTDVCWVFILPPQKDDNFWRGVWNEIPLSEDNIEHVFDVSDEVLQFHETFFF